MRTIASLVDTATQMGQTAKWLRLLAELGVTPQHLQRAIDSKSARTNLAEFLQADCPKINWTDPNEPKAKRVKKGAQTFDEVAYFQTRTGLWVDGDLGRYVGLKVRPSRSHLALKRRVLSKNESEATMFGKSGSNQYAETCTNAVDLGQIACKIDRQWNGEEGELLTDGSANIFPVIGLDSALRVVRVYRHGGEWFVRCDPFNPDDVWSTGDQVFRN
ncbi:hypothetical protein K2P47_02360 [Patescibacteria group bacterium]|nr:hypothetical protein [Patescibacteria group bacterium]